MRVPLTAMMLLLTTATSQICRATPQIIKVGDTSYLKDAESLPDETPVHPKKQTRAKPTPEPLPSATPLPTARPSPTPPVIREGDLDEVPAPRNYPPAIIHRSSMNVGSQIPVPTQYAAPQVFSVPNTGVTVVPATPTTFQTIQTGTTTHSDGAGNVTVQNTELSGFVNYGTPIRTVVPVRNEQGQTIGSQTVTVSSNPVILPVTTTTTIQTTQ